MSEAHRWRSELLGEPHTLELDDGPLDYFERGDGPALLFSHGWLANANLWRKVVEQLHTEFRCIALDLPLGSHRTPMAPDADLSPVGVAGLIAAVLERLDLRATTLVGNDSGGAYSQIALADTRNRPQSGSLASSSPPARRPMTSGHRCPSTVCPRSPATSRYSASS